MYKYSTDGVVTDLKKDEQKNGMNNATPSCSPQTVTYESHKKQKQWFLWLLLFVIISLGVYLLCTSFGKKSKRRL